MAGLISTTYEEPKKKTTQTAAAPAANNIAAQAAPTAIQMEYTDPNGNPAIGYSINNRMYKDAAGTQRIDEGSIVANQSGTQAWIMQNGAGVPIANYQPGANAAITNAYQSAVQAANKRLDANIAQIEANRPKINDAYDQLARQNYQGYMQSQEALANQLASQGLYNSGYSDTAKVAQNVGYRSAQSETERARLQALADLETEINIARLNGSANLAELEAEYAVLQNEQANYEREFAHRAAQDLMDRNYQKQRDQIADDRYNTEWEYGKERDAKADAQLEYENAVSAAMNGNFAPLEALGHDTTGYREAWKAQQDSWARAQSEWELTLEQWAFEKGLTEKQFASDEAQRAFDNAMARADIGDFSALEALGVDITELRAMWNRQQELLNLEKQAAYQDIVLGNQQIAANQSALQQQEEEEANTTVDFNALYRQDPGKYNEVVGLAEQFAANTAGLANNKLSEQFLSAYNTAEKYYGKDYAELWRETVLAAMQPEETGYETFDASVIENWKDTIYGDTTTYTFDGTGDEANKTGETKSRTVVNPTAQANAAWQLLAYYEAGGISQEQFDFYLNEIGVDTERANEIFGR